MVAVVLAKWATGLSEWRDVIASENGPVERMSAVLWFMGFVWAFMAAWNVKNVRLEWLSLSTLFLLFGLRELDAHVWITGWNLDKLANYWNPAIPLQERLLVVVLMVVPCILVGAIVIARFWEKRSWVWQAEQPWGPHVIMGLALLVLCTSIDKIGPYALPYLGVGDPGKIALMIIEEFLELMLPVFVLNFLWPSLQGIFGVNGCCERSGGQ